jgi:chemotaxis protein MotA
MLVIVGVIVVFASVIGGFTIAGGHVGALIHPSELLTIGGASFGALLMMCPMKVVKDLFKGVLATLKGSSYGKQTYLELIGALNDLFALARRDGLLALEPHISAPHESAIIKKYPTLEHSHHNLSFFCSCFGLMLNPNMDKPTFEKFVEVELAAIHQEHHAPIGVLAKTADALPGFGIVAAVLGIVITMGHINGPVEEIGHKVGAALVGTFLGILLSYGVFGPLTVKLEFIADAEMAYFRAISTIVGGFIEKFSPKDAIELGRRGLASDIRPSEEEVAQIYANAKATSSAKTS